MNVLIIADYKAPQSGNFIASVLELGLMMRRQSNNVVYMFPEMNTGGGIWRRWLAENAFDVYCLENMQNEENVLQIFRQIINRHQIDIIHSHFGFLHKFLLLNHRKMGKEIKIIFHDHMDFSAGAPLRRQKIKTAVYALSYRMFDAYVISVMEKKNHAYRLAGKKRSRYITNGLSLKRAETDQRTRQELREELNVGCNEKLALFFGWDLYRKGLDIAVQGISRCRSKYPGLKLGVIGAGHGKPYPETEKFLRANGCDPRAEWILYLNDCEDIFALDKAVDVYVSASRKEAFSYGILEAVSQNTPVVVSDIEGTSWAREFDKCVTFTNEDADDCAQAIGEALTIGRRESNYRSVIQKYSVDEWCNKIMSFYAEISGE